jgi:hypothetical protein
VSQQIPHIEPVKGAEQHMNSQLSAVLQGGAAKRDGVAHWMRRLAALSVPIAALVLAMTPAAAASVPSVPSETVGSWSANGLAAARPNAPTAGPASQPIYTCVGDLHVQPVLQHLETDAYAQCDIQLDQITFSWTWFDANTGAVLLSDHGQQTSTTSLSSGEAGYMGTPGSRNIEVCFNTYLAGFAPSGDCLWAYNK